jgi:hypothetical protein
MEKKYNDTYFTMAGSSTGTIGGSDTIVDVAQGTAENERIGLKIGIKSIHVKCLVAANATTQVTDAMRVFLVVDRQCNGAAPTVAEYLQNSHITGFNNLQYSKRFYTLFDKTIGLNVPTNGVNEIVPMEYYKEFRKPLVVKFSSTGGTVSDIVSNNVFIGCICYNSSNQAQVVTRCRIRYYDP